MAKTTRKIPLTQGTKELMLDVAKQPDRPRWSLGGEMWVLVQYVRNAYEDWVKAGSQGDRHHHLYHRAADRFDLYDHDQHAPIWLSRVVAGILQDIDNGDTDAV